MTAARRPADRKLDTIVGAALGNLHNTAPFDVTGHPAMNVLVDLSNGLPVGMMLVGRHCDEAAVLRAAHAWRITAG